MMNLEGGGGTQLVMPGACALVTSSDGSLTDTFPVGLRVMVVDDDLICLSILERMLHKCSYNATKCTRAERALSLLRANKNGYDVILSDIRMPDMDGFRFLELVGLEMDLPVIMMSADDGKNVVLQGVTHGACDYLIKPVRIEALKNIWQHVARKKRRNEWRDVEQSGSVEDGDRLQPQQQPKHDDADYSSAADDGSWRNSKRRKDDEEDGEDKDDTSTLKKPRVVWSAELHQQFVTAVKQLGIDKAVPKKILELMNVPGLTRENVASHLQKYRLYLRRITAVGPHQAMMNQSFLNPHGAAFGQMPPLAGFDLQALAISGQLLPHNHHTSSVLVRPASKPMDQRNIFSFEIPKQQQQYPSLMHGYHPTLISRQQQQQPSLLQSSSSPPPPIQQQQNDQTQMSEGFHHRQQRQMVGSISDSMNNMYNPPPVSQSEASPPVQTKPGSSLLFHGTEQQDPEEMEKKASSLLPSYDLVHQKTKYAWEMQHHHHHHHHQALSHFNASSAVQLGLFRHNNNSLPSSGGEGVPAGAFGQDDLLNALLKQETVLGGEEFGIEAFSLDNIPL